jgi:hypothetical protein
MKFYLVLPNCEGPITQSQAQENKPNVFQCGVCSTEEEQVFHNLLGRHRHSRRFTNEGKVFDVPISKKESD